MFSSQQNNLLKEMHTELSRLGQTIATAESCTSGLLAFLLTTQPGSSLYYLGGINSYSNTAKENILGVSPDLISRVGAVSSEVAHAMASQTARIFNADIGLSTTGIAGPDGGTAAKPCGTVWMGLSYKGVTQTKQQVFSGDRHEVRMQSGFYVLRWLLDELQNKSK